MNNTQEQIQKGIELVLKELDLINVKYFNYEIISKGFWDDQFFDRYKLHYKQWWKISKVIKIKRNQNSIYPYEDCDIQRITHRYSDESLVLLGVLQSLGTPQIKI